VKKPKFLEHSELSRFISGLNRLRNNRPAIAAFLPDPPSAKPEKDYLSVNSLEVESLRDIANYHRAKWQSNEGKVALTVHKVAAYTDAGRKCGISISYDRSAASWVFVSGSASETAYMHHPVLRSDQLQSPSHCGIEFTRALKNQNDAAKFARRMVTNRFHLV
jgi:hypothetical protein